VKPRLDPTIVTDRLVLRAPRADDVDDLVAGIGDPVVTRMLGRVPLPYRRTDGEEFVARAQRTAQEGRTLNLSIFRDQRLVGGIGIANMPGYNELGYWLARSAWGHGFATEAGKAVLAFGFDVLGLKLMRSAVNAENRASLRVQQKLGFAAIGRSMHHSLARGHAVPCIDTVLTRSRYQALAR
jgi:RimJ/RimL family protein N-acetyltransferase